MDLRIKELAFGKVRSVDGSHILVKAESLKLHKNGESSSLHVEVGAFVNCGDFHGDTICMVSRIRVEEIEKKIGVWEENKIVELSIVGSVNDQDRFSRGVDQLPPITCDVYLLTGEQINHLLGIVGNLPKEERQRYFKVGKRSMKGGGDVYFDLDKLLGRHVAILGTTGSGKSSTVARIAQSILIEYPQPRIMFFDMHNEYREAFSDQWVEKTNQIDWEDFSLPYWYLDLEEFIQIYYPEAGGNQVMILKNIIEELKKNSANESIRSRVTVDSPIFYDIEHLIKNIETLASAETTAKRDPFNKMINRIKAVNQDARFGFLKSGMENQKSLTEYFIDLFGLNPNSPKYITVLDLSGLPAEIRTICVGVLARLCFDYRYWDLDPEHLPLALVLEEAHSYIPEERNATYSLCLDRVEKIAKEGRKYGISLIVVTQRPSNVSTTVLSQCGTFITLRLTSDLDQNKVKRLLPDTIGDQAEILPSLRDREALVTGDAVPIPGRVRFDEPYPWPKSKDIKFHKAWTQGPPPEYNIDTIIESWNLREKPKH